MDEIAFAISAVCFGLVIGFLAGYAVPPTSRGVATAIAKWSAPAHRPEEQRR